MLDSIRLPLIQINHKFRNYLGGRRSVAAEFQNLGRLELIIHTALKERKKLTQLARAQVRLTNP